MRFGDLKSNFGWEFNLCQAFGSLTHDLVQVEARAATKNRLLREWIAERKYCNSYNKPPELCTLVVFLCYCGVLALFAYRPLVNAYMQFKFAESSSESD
eukprot:4613168-Amphidinium_carterae.1